MRATLAGSMEYSRGRTVPMALPVARSNFYRGAPADPIRIGLVHSDPIMGAGLRSAFSAFDDFEVESSANDMPMVLADYANAMALMKAGSQQPRRPTSVIVAGSDRECEIRQALAMGAKGYLVGFTPEELATCVRAVHRGEKYLSPLAATRLAESLSCDPLTCREKEVMQLVAKGLANKQIASRLGIAVYTVKSHLKSIFEKLRVRSRTQAMAMAETRGMLEA